MRKKLTELRQKWLNEAAAALIKSGTATNPLDVGVLRADGQALAACADELGKAMAEEA